MSEHLFPTRHGNWHVIDGKLVDLDCPNSLPNEPVPQETKEEAVAPPRSGKSRTAPEE